MKDKDKDIEPLVKKFLSKINPSGWRTDRKTGLADFEKGIFRSGPQVCLQDERVIQLLLMGSKQYPKGLLKICGEHSVSNLVAPTLTRASVIALKLLAKLLDPSQYIGATHIHKQLKNIPVAQLALPNFAHHLIGGNSPDESTTLFEIPTRVISIFLSEVPTLQLSDFISDDWARYFYLRRVLGYFSADEGFSDSIWLTCVRLPNFSHSMVVEFLTTSKKRLPREVWMKNITTYITKCKPILSKETTEIFLSGIPKTKVKGLIDMCTANKPHSSTAQELLLLLLDESIYSEAGRVLDFLLERRDLLKELGYPNKTRSPFDTKLYNFLTHRAKVGDVKEVLQMLHESKEDLNTWEVVPSDKSRDGSFDNFKKTFGNMKRERTSSGSTSMIEVWTDCGSQNSYPSVLSMLDDTPTSPMSPRTPSFSTPTTPRSPTTPPLPPAIIFGDFGSVSSSPISSRGGSEEYPPSTAALILDTNAGAPITPQKPQLSTEHALTIATLLQQFFDENSTRFSRMEYRRMLIFLMSLVSTKRDKTDMDLDAIFEELGLDNNPQIEVTVNELFELLEEAGITFTEAVCTLWATSIMKEIATTERYLDP